MLGTPAFRSVPSNQPLTKLLAKRKGTSHRFGCLMLPIEPSLARKMADKIWNLRVMDDEAGVMNRSIADTTREVMVVSQFTLYGDTSAGRRPSWIAAARPEHAEPLVAMVVDELRRLGATVATGRFRTHMNVSLVNDGPSTVMIELP